VDADVFEVVDVEGGVLGHGGGEFGEGGEDAAGEDVFLNPVGVTAVGVVALVGDGDDLEGNAAAGFEEAVEGVEVGAVVGVADGFEHFDGDDAVVGAGGIAVVAEVEGDLVG